MKRFWRAGVVLCMFWSLLSGPEFFAGEEKPTLDTTTVCNWFEYQYHYDEWGNCIATDYGADDCSTPVEEAVPFLDQACGLSFGTCPSGVGCYPARVIRTSPKNLPDGVKDTTIYVSEKVYREGLSRAVCHSCQCAPGVKIVGIQNVAFLPKTAKQEIHARIEIFAIDPGLMCPPRPGKKTFFYVGRQICDPGCNLKYVPENQVLSTTGKVAQIVFENHIYHVVLSPH